MSLLEEEPSLAPLQSLLAPARSSLARCWAALPALAGRVTRAQPAAASDSGSYLRVGLRCVRGSYGCAVPTQPRALSG